MFSLVVTIISILLVASLTYMGLYYMGGVSDSAHLNAKAAQVLNSATQIQASVNLYENEHAGMAPASFQDLVTSGYLKAIPDGSWAFNTNAIQSNIIVANVDQCAAVNKKLYGDPTVPSCSTITNDKIICCSTP